MLDLDDSGQLRLYDRQDLLARAENGITRWQKALAVKPIDFSAQSVQVIWLDFPPDRQGVARLVQDLCGAERAGDAPQVLVWQKALAHLPLTSRTLTEADLPPFLREELAHPADLFLGILALLGKSPESTELASLDPALTGWRINVPIDKNPAKGLAQSLGERLPIFWAEAPLLGLAQVWAQRLTRYAERQAQWMEGDILRTSQVMARFPPYWPQAAALIQLAPHGTPEDAQLARLFRSRRMVAQTLRPDRARSLLETLLYFLEMGEWFALYSAALIGVDPAERVALDFLAIDPSPDSPSPQRDQPA